MQRHQAHLAQHLGLPRPELPTYSTVRRLLMLIDFHALANAFNTWAQTNGLVQAGHHCAVDGKGLSNTVTDAHDSQQDFVNVVSVFQLEQGLVVGQSVFNNHDQSEIEVVYALLKRLQLSGVTYSLDALHAQKKQCSSSTSRGMIT